MPLLLLDFDGVVLRNHPIYAHVSQRCQVYAQKFIPIRNPIKMRQVNQELYEAYGHTVLGLKAMGYPADLQEFNHFVYGNIDIKTLYDVKETHAKDIVGFKEMMKTVKGEADHVEVRLFTNAPDVWCSTIFELMGIEQIAKVNVNGQYLKPDPASYEVVERKFPNERNIIFVDDKLVNLRSIAKRPTWHKILYTGGDATDVTHQEMPSISILNDIKHLTKTTAWAKGTASVGKSKHIGVVKKAKVSHGTTK